MADPFSNMADSVQSPARQMFVITPHATNQVDPLPKAIRADGAGTITLQAADSVSDVTINVVAGEVVPVRARFVRASGTTVATIHGLA
ncbi:hypothetical protein [Novosphingobium sp.]|uniref:spike base protein, RCAP_Rcc01079 family n=1 Tax=Novosphingobium sp. TaxID=1874826 RepID=UPI0038BD06CD